jgi:hypothetical protein
LLKRAKGVAKKSEGFNLTATIREYRQGHRDASANEALEAIKKANPSHRINQSTFLATFYKLRSGGKRKVVKRPKPGRVVSGDGSAEAIMKAGLNFVRLAGSVEAARERLVGLEELIETAKAVE